MKCIKIKGDDRTLRCFDVLVILLSILVFFIFTQIQSDNTNNIGNHNAVADMTSNSVNGNDRSVRMTRIFIMSLLLMNLYIKSYQVIEESITVFPSLGIQLEKCYFFNQFSSILSLWCFKSSTHLVVHDTDNPYLNSKDMDTTSSVGHHHVEKNHVNRSRSSSKQFISANELLDVVLYEMMTCCQVKLKLLVLTTNGDCAVIDGFEDTQPKMQEFVELHHYIQQSFHHLSSSSLSS